MLREKVTAYIGFAKRKKSFFVGRALEEKLLQKRILLLVFLPECSLRRKNHLLRLIDREKIIEVEESENIDIQETCGIKKISAFGISDASLANALKEQFEISRKEEN